MSQFFDTGYGAAGPWLSGVSAGAILWEPAALIRCHEVVGKYVEMPAPFIIVKGRFVADRFD